MGLMPISSPIATMVRKVATRMVTLVQSPSSPSVKFTPLSVPSTIKNRAGIKRIPSERNLPPSNPPVKGISISVPTSPLFNRYQANMPVITNCPTNFCIGFRPSERFITILI